jgi:hypothetical protein
MDDDRHRWEAAAAKVTMRPCWPMPMRARVRDQGPGWLMLVVELDAPDIHTGEMQTVHIAETIHPKSETTEGQMVDVIVWLYRRAVQHELDECLLVDGSPAREPHPELTRSKAVTR